MQAAQHSSTNAPSLSNVLQLQLALQLSNLLSQLQPSPLPVANTPDLLALLTQQTARPAQATPALTSANSRQSSLSTNDALDVGPPVGTFADDEDILVQALCDGEVCGLNYKKVLEALHGTNKHVAFQWKDYYLENAQHINRLVAAKLRSDNGQTPAVSHKRPLAGTPRHSGVASTSKKRASTTHSASTVSEPASALRCPTPPPSPPPRAPKYRRGYAWTEAEDDFLVRYVHYRYHKDPQVSKVAICEGMHEKAPQHTSKAWNVRWLQRQSYFDERINALGAELGTGVVTPPFGTRGRRRAKIAYGGAKIAYRGENDSDEAFQDDGDELDEA